MMAEEYYEPTYRAEWFWDKGSCQGEPFGLLIPHNYEELEGDLDDVALGAVVERDTQDERRWEAWLKMEGEVKLLRVFTSAQEASDEVDRNVGVQVDA
jgi:hypothetical protein